VVLAEQTVLPAADLVALSADAVVLRSTAGAVYRSVLLPGWGQFYNRQPYKGGLFIVAEVSAGVAALLCHLLGDGRAGAYAALGAGTPPEVFAGVRAEGQAFYQARDGLLIGLAVVHALNILDAFVFGTDYDSATPGGGVAQSRSSGR
jgi:hypothetical protein